MYLLPSLFESSRKTKEPRRQDPQRWTSYLVHVLETTLRIEPRTKSSFQTHSLLSSCRSRFRFFSSPPSVLQPLKHMRPQVLPSKPWISSQLLTTLTFYPRTVVSRWVKTPWKVLLPILLNVSGRFVKTVGSLPDFTVSEHGLLQDSTKKKSKY